MTDWSFNPVGGYQLTSAIALALLLLLTLLGLPKHRLSPGRRTTLVALRAAVIVLAVLAMLRPALVETTTKKQSSTLILLVDESRSMGVGDGVGGKTRWRLLQSAIDEALPALDKLSEDVEVKAYGFDDTVHALDVADGRLDLPATPEGQQTAIGAALEDVLRRESGKRLAGVILLSDGAQRAYAPHDLAPQGPARRLADLGYPLYALAFGQARGLGQSRDVVLRDLSVNQTVYVKNNLAVHATARVEGYPGKSVPVQLLLENGAGKMEVVSSEELAPGPSGQATPIDMQTIPQSPGEFKLTLRATPQPGELVTTNNEISTFVTVLKGGVNVLYLEGALRVDSKYLLRSLDASSDIKVDFLRFDPRDPAQRPANLIERFERGKYDVYMLGDVDVQFFTRDELLALARVVREGAGLIMLGGFHTFGPGGYADTPLAELMPMAMEARERQRLIEAPRTDMHLNGPIKIRPTRPLGQRHYLMSLSDRDSRDQSWEKLPALEGANRLGTPKPEAQILAESADGRPLLMVQDRAGRSIAFAGDSTWHWWMEGFDSQHKRFWRQMILWAAHKDEVGDSRLWIRLAARRFAPRSTVEFTAGARTPQDTPLPNATYEAEVTGPNGERRKLNLVRQGDQVSGSFDGALAAGDYAVSVTASENSVPLGAAKARFLVYEQDLELDNAVADPTLLAALAAMTKEVGGRMLAPEELGDLLRHIQERPAEVEVESLVKHTPWDTWPFFLLFIGLISTEWYLRKKWGLV